MAIVKMKGLRLLAMRSDREALLELLQGMGCVEIDEPDQDPQTWQGLLSQLGSQTLSRPDGQALSQAREDLQAAQRALAVLKRHGDKGRGLLAPRPRLTRQQLFDGEEQGKQAVQQVLEADRQLAALEAQHSKLLTQRAALAPWLELNIPLDTASTQEMVVQFGTVTAGVELEQVQRAVEGASELAQLTQASVDRDVRYCLLVCHTSAQEEVLQALRDFGWSRMNLSGWTGTAKENDQRIARELEQNEQETAQAEQQLAQLTSLAEPIRQAADRASVRINREEGRSRLLDTEKTFLLEGWVPEENWPQLESQMKNYPCAWELRDPTEEEYPKVPVKLKNNWFTRPLSMVTEMYSLPAYNGLDPNPLMAPFFILFYGIMMADMGYGLLMMIASVVVLKKSRPRAGMHNFFALLGLCGVSTFIMGAVTGGFFGDFIPQLLKLINPESTFVWFWPTLFTPLEDTMMILVGAMALGFVQILVGMAISFVKKLRRGQVMDAIWEEVTWWVVFAGLALAILGVTNLVIILGGVMVVAGPILTEKGFGKITGIFGSLYNHVTGYFGDILSYSRLMALMLAGSVIAQVFNTLGAIPGNVVIFIIISMLGNALNFALNLLGCYVHDLRLQCLEYFNKFYEDGGKPFRPMKLDTNYYDVVK
ncbi:MAG: V-type ATP synthase subunit I [Flintibacter sp.]|uniref:V-type ATP synthase subunit I n=1 Tax=Flintibacter sp. TaxID=1918624 RepID=UPI0026737558|nr:V-type ATP synthase subunit I [Flintibacter sp.]MCI6150166.1 V-type ATP synthase subunit I [Flintibacter sp.]MDD7115186.1 V-type ATP synthase subunit I [Flintibacter sp.]MDY5038087.1 V-type ATP synthase subunit I [Lawsonibacter sp.]